MYRLNRVFPTARGREVASRRCGTVTNAMRLQVGNYRQETVEARSAIPSQLVVCTFRCQCHRRSRTDRRRVNVAAVTVNARQVTVCHRFAIAFRFLRTGSLVHTITSIYDRIQMSIAMTLPWRGHGCENGECAALSISFDANGI